MNNVAPVYQLSSIKAIRVLEKVTDGDITDHMLKICTEFIHCSFGRSQFSWFFGSSLIDARKRNRHSWYDLRLFT